MSPRENVRSNMVDGAVILLATQGVEGTSFKEVLGVANAPRGSVYHHFPGGKSELPTRHSIGLAAGLSRRWRRLVARALSRSSNVSSPLAGAPDYSQLRAGCAVVSVTVSGPEDDVLEHVGAIFRTWTEQLAELFVVGGMVEDAAHLWPRSPSPPPKGRSSSPEPSRVGPPSTKWRARWRIWSGRRHDD